MAKVMPPDWSPPVRSGSNASGEWNDAMKAARENIGQWIEVHEPRTMKPPTAWCSEVRLNQKNGQRDDERWEADYAVITGADGTKRYAKYVKVAPRPPRDPNAPAPVPPAPPEVQPVPSAPYGSQ